jgi:hypothetical protein
VRLLVRSEQEAFRLTVAVAFAGGISVLVGDPIAPLAAIEDELRRHDFDEVILAMHPQAHTNWLETQLLERTRAQLSIPVRRLVIGSEQLATTTEASS